MIWHFGRISTRCGGALVALLLAAALVPPVPAFAATFAVSKTADTNDGACTPADCSLREAITAANASPGADTVTVPAGIFALQLAVPADAEPEDANLNGDLDITGPLTLAGAGAARTIISAANVSDRVLHILSGSSTVSGVTLRDGGGRGEFGAPSGGGVQVEPGAGLTLRDSVVTANRAQFGAGIAAYGDVALAGVTVSLNAGNTSAGIDMAQEDADLPAPVFSAINSTISGNSATFSGGGLGVFAGAARLTSVTISGNVADSNADGGGNGGGVFVDDGAGATLSFAGSILAANRDRSVDDIVPDCGGTLLSLGYNLTQSEAGCVVVGVRVGDVVAAPMLSPLLDNGGPTPTHALLPGSPALDAGPPIAPDGACPALDQRGATRPLDANGDGEVRCDIGALEAVPGNLALDASVAPDIFAGAAPLAYTASVTNAGPNATPGLAVQALLAEGAAYISGGGTGWACVVAGRSVNCTYGSLAAGATTAPVTITARAPAGAGTVTATFELVSGTLDSNSDDNSATLVARRGRATLLPFVLR